ncbi:MAG: HNH endonuclease, partial [Acidipropionibacterium sp.]|nr:HNH endonuclease [Acidipropionibacterium sp.]
LKRATQKILEEVAPEAAPSPGDEAARIAAQRSRAVKDRRLVWGSDGEGSTWFSGQLPDLEAQQVIGTLQAFGEKGRRAERDEAEALRDKRTEGRITDSQYLTARLELESREARSTAQRMADALIDMVGLLASLDKVPAAGGQTPRLVVTLNYQDLHDALEEKIAAGVVHGAIGEIPVDAGSLRRMCCEAGILPVMLGGESQVMDMGQERRLVTGAIRRALEVRDKHCIHPGCTVPANLCQAHHIIPWWDEGPTSLENLVLVCRHHHALVEPDRYHSRDQWRIVVDPDTRIPRMLPPERLKKHLPQSAVDPVAGGTSTVNMGESSAQPVLVA